MQPRSVCFPKLALALQLAPWTATVCVIQAVAPTTWVQMERGEEAGVECRAGGPTSGGLRVHVGM